MMVFQEEAPQVAASFNYLIEALSSSDGLDAKTRQLIYIGIKASEGDTGAVMAHNPMAKAAGLEKCTCLNQNLLYNWQHRVI